jgi:AraC-like DNA-binding protein
MGLISIFRDHGKIYKADTCQPLVEAAEKGKVQLAARSRGGYPGKRLAPHDLPGLRSVGFWDAAYVQDWGLGWHRNEGIEITLLETGSAPFFVNQHQCLLQPGDLTITHPWQPHRVGDPRILAGRLTWIILDVGVRRPNQEWQWPKWIVLQPRDIERLSDFLRQNDKPVWKATPEIIHCFKRMGHALEKREDDQTISRLAVYMNELFLLILEMFQHHLVDPNPSFSGAQMTLQLFFDDLRSELDRLSQPWSVEEMAKECGMGVTSFIYYCKKITNLTPGKYLNQLRLEAAAEFLVKEPNKSVTDVAFSCGFSSSQYFANSFRRYFRLSPSAYRNQKHAL